jgi:hypothetical protein
MVAWPSGNLGDAVNRRNRPSFGGRLAILHEKNVDYICRESFGARGFNNLPLCWASFTFSHF